MSEKKFKVGEEVSWPTRKGSLTGKVVFVDARGLVNLLEKARKSFNGHKIMFRMSGQYYERTYLVSVPQPGKRQPKLYKPDPKKLVAGSSHDLHPSEELRTDFSMFSHNPPKEFVPFGKTPAAKTTGIKIYAQKVVFGGVQVIKINGFKALKFDDLPEEYTAGYPYAYTDNNVITVHEFSDDGGYTATGHELKPGVTISIDYYNFLLTLLFKCGARLKEINERHRKAAEEWAGPMNEVI